MQKTRLILTFFAVGSAGLSCVHLFPHDARRHDLARTTGRQALALHALDNESELIRGRAISELAAAGVAGPACAKAAVRLLLRVDDGPPSRPGADLAITFSRLGRPAVPHVLRALRKRWIHEGSRWSLLISLGRMGAVASDAIPELRPMLNGPRVSPEKEAVLRVVLADLGDVQLEHVEFLEAHIRRGTSAGLAAAYAMAFTLAKAWVTEPMMEGLREWLRGDSADRCIAAALALGVMGQNAALAADDLAGALRRAASRPDVRLACAASLARICPNRGRPALLSEFRAMGGRLGTGEVWLTVLEISQTVIDPELRRWLVGLLGSEEPAVVRGAAWVLIAGHEPIPGAADRLIAVVASHEHPDMLRGMLAGRLGYLLEPTAIPKLVALARQETYDGVRADIESSLHVLSLGKFVSIEAEDSSAAPGLSSSPDLTRGPQPRVGTNMGPTALVPTSTWKEGGSRRNQLLRVIEKMTSTDPCEAQPREVLAQLRAIQELTAAGSFDTVLCRLLVETLRKQTQQYWACTGALQSSMALSMAGETAVPWIVKAIGDMDPNDIGVWFCLMALGRMGPEARQAAPVLERLLHDPRTRAERRVEIRVVLANLGQPSREGLEEIGSHIRRCAALGPWDERPDWLWRTAPLDIMAASPCNEWVTEELVGELGKCLSAPAYVSLLAATALGVMGQRAAPAAPQLRTLIAALEPGEASSRLLFATCLARIDPKDDRTALRSELKRLGSGLWTGFHLHHLIPLLANTDLIDASLRTWLVGRLGDSDADVRRGAAYLLLWIGMPAREAVDRLLLMMKSESDEVFRCAAAYGLGLMLNPSRLHELEALVIVERDDMVREALIDSIEVVTLEQ